MKTLMLFFSLSFSFSILAQTTTPNTVAWKAVSCTEADKVYDGFSESLSEAMSYMMVDAISKTQFGKPVLDWNEADVKKFLGLLRTCKKQGHLKMLGEIGGGVEAVLVEINKQLSAEISAQRSERDKRAKIAQARAQAQAMSKAMGDDKLPQLASLKKMVSDITDPRDKLGDAKNEAFEEIDGIVSKYQEDKERVKRKAAAIAYSQKLAAKQADQEKKEAAAKAIQDKADAEAAAKAAAAQAAKEAKNWCSFTTQFEHGREELFYMRECECDVTGTEVARQTAGQKGVIEVKDANGKVIEAQLKIVLGDPDNGPYAVRKVRFYRNKDLCQKGIAPFKAAVDAAEKAQKKREEAYE